VKRSKEDISFNIWITLWCAMHMVGYTEKDAQGNVWTRTKEGYSAVLAASIDTVTVTGTIYVE